ncbi:hypothetical protein GOV06_02330 [Candidatus Woesearchaeota archaeon]|nr:hypothetical protein [Candidatus Woesearchaeota archaeon]
MKKCAKCGSTNIKSVEFMGSKVYYCKDCGYDERDALSVVPEQRTSQREKTRHSPYRTGGGKRTR